MSDLDVDFFDDDIYESTPDLWLPIRSWSWNDLYTNAKQFVFSFNYDIPNINIRDISNNLYNI